MGNCPLIPYYEPNDKTFGVMGGFEFCFSRDTKIKKYDEEKIYNIPIKDIKKNDYVLTFEGNDKIYSKVKENTRIKGTFIFYEFKMRDKNSNIKTISVTKNHKMIVFGKEKNEIQFKEANKVKIGDLMRTLDGIFEVFEINQVKLKNCYKLVVQQGTVLANDILIGAVYFNKDESTKEINKVLNTAKISNEIKV